jgi:hypothetical protein
MAAILTCSRVCQERAGKQSDGAEGDERDACGLVLDLTGGDSARQPHGCPGWVGHIRAVSPPPYLPRFAGEGFSGGGGE